MTKSIEEQAEEYSETCDNESGSFLSRDLMKIRKKAYVNGAKARDEQWLKVVKELRSAVHCDYGCKTNQDHGWMVVKCNCGTEKSLAKADQMLKEMGL